MQPADEKRDALISILPLLHHHLHLLCSLRSGLGNLTPHIPEGPPRPIAVCAWDCPTCPELGIAGAQCPPDEMWVRTEKQLASRYRLYAVQRSLLALNDHRKILAQAVYYQHVEPWDAWNPYRRPGWAEEGVYWMADEIPGELVAFGPGGKERQSTPDTAADLRSHGHSYHQIAKRLGISKTAVHYALKGRPGRAKDAGG